LPSVSTITYEPDAEYTGLDTITVTATDDDGAKIIKTSTITVNDTNTAPVAVDDSVRIWVNETNNETINTLKIGTFNHETAEVSDWGDLVDGKAVFTQGDIKITTSVSEGELTAYNQSGDSVGLGIGNEDSKGLDQTEILTVEIEGANANRVDFTLDGLGSRFDEISNKATEILITAYDTDGSIIETQGGFRQSGQFEDVYSFETNIPVAKFEITSDGSTGNFVVQNLTLSATDAIEVPGHWENLIEDSSLTINSSQLLSNDSDVDGGILSISKVTATADTHGIVSLDSDGNVVFTPEDNYNGEASFTYTISDGQGGTDTATVTLTVDAVNDSISLVSDSNSAANTIAENVSNGAEIGITANAVDVDGDTVNYSIVDSNGDSVTNGPFTINENTGVVTLRDNTQIDYESDTSHDIQIKATSSDGTSSTQTFTINVTDIDENIAPEAVNDSSRPVEITTTNTIFSSTFEDVSSNAFHNQADEWSSDGKIEVRDHSIDGGQAADGSQYIELNNDPKNDFDDAPNIWRDVNTNSDGEYTLNFKYSARPGYDDSVCRIEVVLDGEVIGTFSADGRNINAPSWNDATINFSGSGSLDRLEFREAGTDVDYGRGMFVDAINLEETITTTSDQPFTIDEDQSFTVSSDVLLANDSDSDGGILSIVSVQDAQHGSVSLNGNGDIVYTPDADYSGIATFTYTLSDGQGGMDTATVTLNVTAIDDTAVTPNLSVDLGDAEVHQSKNGATEVSDLSRPSGLSDIESVDTDGNDTYNDLKSSLYKSNDNTVDTIEINKDQKSTVSTYGGDDIINIDGDSKSVINLGEGNNRLDIDGDAKSALYMGDGDDSVRVGGDLKSAVDLNDGDNILDVSGDAKSNIYSGNNDDTIIIGKDAKGQIGTQAGDDRIYVQKNAEKNIDTGSGNDTLDVGGDTKGSIYLGSGNDILNVDKNAKGNISGGSGNDQISVAEDAKGQITLGSGNDNLYVGGGTNKNIYADSDNDKVYIGGEIKSYVMGGSGTDSIELGRYSKADWDDNTDNIQKFIGEFENIKFNDGTVIGNESAFSVTSNTVYEYPIKIDATTNDDSESITSIQITGLPDGSTLSNTAGDILNISKGSISLTIEQLSGLKLTTTQALADDPNDAIHIEVTATATEENGGDTAVMTANLIDGVVEGIEYQTSSGLQGFTDENGGYSFQAGDTITFKVGGVILGEVSAEEAMGGQTFLQDIADVARTDMNDEYLENMATFLQSIDSDSSDNIVISSEMHQSLAEADIDLRTASEGDVKDLVESAGGQYVDEEAAMEHVQDMLEEYAGMDESSFDLHTDDQPDSESISAHLINTASEGISYETSSGLSGQTDSHGSFEYEEGDSISFINEQGEVFSTITSDDIGDDALISMQELTSLNELSNSETSIESLYADAANSETYNPFDESAEGADGWVETTQDMSIDSYNDPDTPWSVLVDGQEIEHDQAAQALDSTPDSSGVVHFNDGSEVGFDSVDKLDW